MRFFTSAFSLIHAFDNLARQRARSIFIIFILSFGGSWLWAQARGIPYPYVHDEFSYLLAGDTFAHGRLTNPTPPMWLFLETFYCLMRPTYMSEYPPGQGLFLAMGQVIFGHPIYGVWLSAGLMCAAMVWMLYAWIAPRWALLGGIVAVLQFGVFTYWSQSYWGGAVAALGGALVFGALPRILRYRRLRDALWLGLGCVILGISRPLEGFLIAIPVGCLILPWKMPGGKFFSAAFIAKIVLPVLLILGLLVAGMGYYNKQITGRALVSPHFLYDQTHSRVPIFTFQTLRPRVHFDYLPFYLREKNWPLVNYELKKTTDGLIYLTFVSLWHLTKFYFGYWLIIPALLISPLFLRQWQRVLRYILAFCIFLIPLTLTIFIALPHYYAPLTALVVLWVTIGLKWLSYWKWDKTRMGMVGVIGFLTAQLVYNVVFTPVVPNSQSLAKPGFNHILLPARFSRQALEQFLLKRGGKYLVIVLYTKWHSFHFEWVHNGADIDHAPIIWAHYRGPAQTKALVNYFKDRQPIYVKVFWDEMILFEFDKRQ